MSYILNVVYVLLVIVASPWLIYSAIRRGKYRQGWTEKLLGRVPVRTGQRTCIWFHAVSVGEANLLQTLLSRIERERPDVECVISVTTKTAFEVAEQKYAPRTVFYCPLDFSWAVSEAMRRIRPNLLVLTELELWPNLIRATRRSDAQVALINGRLSDKSFRGYRRIRALIAPLLKSINTIAVQNGQYARRFRQLGARDDSVHVTGSLKFDGARTNRNNEATRRLAELAGIESDDTIFLAGSTQDPEESLALESFRCLKAEYPRLRLILVPRHPERFDEVAKLLDRSDVCWQRRSRLESDGAERLARVLLVDTIGELGAWWGTAHIAYIGGSMGARGGQNMIEPAAYGAAVSFGPKTKNFRDVVAMMLREDAACVVNDGEEMTSFVRRCLDDPNFATELGQRASRLVHSQLGAADRTAAHIQLLLNDPGLNLARQKSAA